MALFIIYLLIVSTILPVFLFCSMSVWAVTTSLMFMTLSTTGAREGLGP